MIPALRPSILTNVASPPDGAAFVASAQMDNTTSPTPASLGAMAGDLAIVSSINNRTPSSGSGGAWLTANTQAKYRVLNGPDLGSGITTSSGGWSLHIYRRAIAIALVSSSQGSGVGSATGFSKANSHAGLFALGNAKSPSGGGGGYEAGASSPATFAGRGAAYFIGGSPVVLNELYASDRLYPANALYPDGSTIGWSGNGPSGNELYVYELRAF